MIEDKLNAIVDSKEAIRQAINDKGVTVDDTVQFDEYPSKIAEISGGGASDPAMTITAITSITGVGTTYKTSVIEFGDLVIQPNNNTGIASLFNGYTNLTKVKSISLVEPYKITSVNQLFGTAITRIEEGPIIDTSMCTNFGSMYYGSNFLVKVPAYDASSATTLLSVFGSATSYKDNFTDFGGFLNVGVGFTISNCRALSAESLVNILNGLRDLTGQSSQILTIGAVNLNKLTPEQIAIGTNKNWRVQ